MKSCCKYMLGGLALAVSTMSLAAQDTVKLQISRSLGQIMTEVRYADRESEQAPILSRIFFLGDQMRMDFGQDDQGFVLFDRVSMTIWHVSPSDKRVTGIIAGKVGKVWPQGWKLSQDEMSSEQGVLSQIRVNDILCVEFKSAPWLMKEAAIIADFRRALAARQHASWIETQEAARQPCSLALEVHAAGVEYSRGLPLAIRYWDGRSRVYQGHSRVQPRPELFELPVGYSRLMINLADQEKAERRQSRSSQTR